MNRTIAVLAGSIILAGMVLSTPVAAQNLVTDGDFEACTAGANYNLGIGFSVVSAATHNKWIDVNQWLCEPEDLLTGSDGQFAKQTTFSNSGSTNLLFQGFPIDTNELSIGTGPEMVLCFDYINQNTEGFSTVPEARVYHFGSTGTLSQFAPWPAGDLNATDAKALNRPQSVWLHDTMPINVDASDEALVVAFLFGFNSGGYTPPLDDLHGVDKVELAVLAPSLNIDPDTLNPKSQGEFITAYIGNPGCLGVADIDPETVKLTALDGNPVDLPAVQWDIQDGVLMVKFDRQDVIDGLANLGPLTGIVTLTVEGDVDSISFSAEDDIEVLDKF